MSLINDMLKDLDGREEKKQQSLTPDAPEGGNTPAAKRWALPGLAAVAALYFIVVQLNLFGWFEQDSANRESIPQPIAINPKWSEVEASQSASVAADTSPEPRATDTKADDSSQDKLDYAAQRIPIEPLEKPVNTGRAITASQTKEREADGEADVALLLNEAAVALQSDHLMTPSHRNAYQLFNAVLVLDESNPVAQQGLATIHHRYLDLAKQAASNGKQAQANLFLRRAELIAPVPDAFRAEMDTSARPVSKNESVESQTDVGADLDSKIRIEAVTTLTDFEWVERLRENGISGDFAQILDLLAEGQELPLTVQFLADQFVRDNQLHRLRDLAELVSVNEPGGRYLEAQQAIATGEFSQARALLRQADPRDQVSANELRLRSAVCQKLRDYQCASQGYQELVGSSFSGINDWLGAAVSLDAMGRNHGALSAYRRVAGSAHPDPAIVDFARRRAAELSSKLLIR